MNNNSMKIKKQFKIYEFIINQILKIINSFFNNKMIKLFKIIILKGKNNIIIV